MSPAPDAIVTDHENAYGSGVARFNQLLAEELGLPLLALADGAPGTHRPLLSFKAAELCEHDERIAAELLARPGIEPQAFFHEWRGLALEHAIAVASTRVLAGNGEVAAELRAAGVDPELAWTPGLLREERALRRAGLRVFSFGMAHKLRLDMFARLRELLEQTGEDWAVYVSAANHETASLAEAEVVFAELEGTFPADRLYVVGNLSDLGVAQALREATYFAAFFPKGVRANNTSVAAAMEHGAVVITNLDEHSPPELVHGDNLLDIDRIGRLPRDPAQLAAISSGARAVTARRGWGELAALVRGGGEGAD